MIAPLPGATPTKPGSCTLPLPGIFADIVDETAHDVHERQGGYPRHQAAVARRCCAPSGATTERYQEDLLPGRIRGSCYVAGDCAHRDEDGYFWIMGRIDDVLNVSGHRLGTMEIESALVANPLVAEAAVVGRPHEIKGESVFAFVVLKARAPDRRRGAAARRGTARLGRQGNRPDRQARRHPLRRQPAQDALRQDHAPPAARDRRARRSRRTFRRWRIRRSSIS